MSDSDSALRPMVNMSPLEIKPHFIKILEDRCRYVKELLSKESDVVRAVQNAFQVIAADESKVRGLQQGLFCLALTDVSHCSAVVNSCVLLTRDNMRSLLTELDFLIIQVWPRLLSEIRINIVHFLTELLPNCNDIMADNVVINFMRRLSSGDWSDENCTLCSLFFRIVEKLRGWFDVHKDMHPHLVLTSLRLLVDFFELNQQRPNPVIATTMRIQISVVDHFLRNHFLTSIKGGRDILRLLLHSSRIPEIQALTHDLIHRSGAICNPKDVGLLYESAPKDVTATLLNHELERWIRFLQLECLDRPNSSLRRHFDFLIKRYFASPSSYLLVPHVIRYIICNIAPENSKLQAPYYQRWTFCLNLIDFCGNNAYAAANAKIALVFDWLFYTSGTCIMSIEPAILAIYRNIHSKPVASITLLQFMFLTVHRLHPPLSNNMRRSLLCAMSEVLKFRVVSDLLPLIEILWKHPKLLAEFESIFTKKLVGSWIEACRAKYAAKVAVPRKPPLPPISVDLTTNSNVIVAPEPKKTPELPTSPRVPPVTTKVDTVQDGGSVIIISVNGSVESTTATTLSKSGSASRLTSLSTPNNVPVLNTAKSSPISSVHPSSPIPTPISPSALQDVASFLAEDANRNDGLSTLMNSHQDESPLAFNHTQLYGKRSSLSPQELTICIQEFPSHALRTCLTQLREVCAVRPSSSTSSSNGIVNLTSHIVLPTNLNRYRQEQGEAICISMQTLLRQMMEDLELLTSPTSNPENGSDTDNRNGGDGNNSMIWLARLAQIFVNLCLAWLRGSLLPSGKRSDEALKESIASPIFMIMRTLCEMGRNDPNRRFLFCFLREIYKFVPRIGYYFLYYLTVTHKEFQPYSEFCDQLDGDGFLKKLITDLRLVGNESPTLLTFILPSVYTAFSNELSGKFDFLDAFLPRMDGGNMLELLGQVVLEHVNFFPTDEILNEALVASLRLDTWSQYQFWQLINAHEIPTEKFIPFIAKLEVGKNDEAISHLLIMLKMDRPSESLLRMLYNRSADAEDLLTMSILHFWSISSTTEMKLADVTLSLTKSNIKLMDRHHEKEKKRRKDEYPLPPLRKILKFLDLIRVKCSNIISGDDKHPNNKDQRCHLLLQNASIQQALQLVSSKASESLKEEFAELLALAEDVEEEDTKSTTSNTGRNLRNLSVRKAAKAEKRMSDRRSTSNAAQSGSDSASEEEYMDFQPKKKKVPRLDFD